FGRGHTNGDAWVLFPIARVVHGGDIFSSKGIPILDGNNGGSGVAIGDTLAKAHAGLASSADQIITGHSTVMTMPDLLEYSVFNKDFLAAVQAGCKAGQSAEQIATSWKTPAKYTGYAQPVAMWLLHDVQIMLAELDCRPPTLTR